MTSHHPHILRSFWGAAFCFAIAVLSSGCSTTNEALERAAPSTVQVAASQGLVAVRIASNRDVVSTYFEAWGELRLRDVATSERVTLRNRSHSGVHHSQFFGALKEGTYEIEGAGNRSAGVATMVSDASTGGVLPNFNVKAGQLTELGTLAFIRKHYPVNTNQFRWGIAPASGLERQAIVSQLGPQFNDQLRGKPVLGWNEDPRLHDARAIYDASRAMTLRAKSPVVAADGRVLLGESFGQIAVRSVQGRWSFLQAPTSLAIRALHVTGDGGILAGADDGLLMIKRAEASSWETIPLPASDASVLHIGRLPGASQLIVVLQTRERFVGLSTDASARQPLQEQFSIPREVFGEHVIYDARGYVFQGDDKLVFVSGSFRSDTKILKYSQGDRDWHSVPAGDGGLPSVWVPMGNGHIGRFGGIPLTGMYFAVSEDDGATWQRRGELNWSNPPRFVSAQTGYAIRTDSRGAFDPEKSEFSVWRTDDAGRNWRQAGTPGTVLGTLVPLGGAESIGYASANGKFFVSKDGGRNWSLEREVQ